MSEQRELTAMAELIEWINSGKYSAGSNTAADIHAKAIELLPKEKRGYMDAFADGFSEGVAYMKSGEQRTTPEGYYSLTYKSMGEL